MTSPALIRPPRVTTACLFIGLSCLMLVLYAGTWLSNWGSIEVQEMVGDAVDSGYLKGLDLTVDGVMGWLRGALMAVAAIGASGVVLAIHTAKGDQASRVILTGFAALAAVAYLVFGGPFGILPAVFALFCGAYLWNKDARLWFGVKSGKIDIATLPVEKPAVEEPKPNPFAAPQQQTPYEGVPTAVSQPAAKRDRPDVVLIAVIVSGIMSSLVVLVCGLNAVAYLIARAEYLKILEDNPMMKEALSEFDMSTADFARVIFIVCAIATVLSVGAVVAAGATLAGRSAGHTALVILSAVTVPLTIFAFPVGLLWTAAAIATLVLLRRPDARSWFTKS